MSTSFERDVRPLFREEDQKAMVGFFDLWSFDDVRAHAEQILAVVAGGQMPCDGTWPQGDVDTLRQWIDAGMAP